MTTTLDLPAPDRHGRYRFADGSLIARPHTLTLNFLPLPTPVDPASVYGSDKWVARWADGTPLRSDNDETSYFDSPLEAAEALAAAGEGPAREPWNKERIA